MRRRAHEFKFHTLERADDTVLVRIEESQQFRDLLEAIAGAAYATQPDLHRRSVRIWRLTCAVGRTEALLAGVAGTPFRGVVAVWPRIRRGDGPAVFRMDSNDPLSRSDRDLIALLVRSVAQSEGWL